jgi:hypothetical protein
MPTPIETPVTGLSGAIGSHYHGPSHRLYFVEFGGKLSRYDFVRALDSVVLNQTILLKGTWNLNLETGVQGASPGADLWWNQQTSVKRQMVPRNSARIAYVGPMTPAQFAAFGPDQLQALDYGTTPIVGDNNAGNRLVNGTVFAVRTTAGNYAKLRVVSYGYDIRLAIVNYKLQPAYQVLGTGYTQPEDVKITANGKLAYITERSGNLLRVSLVGPGAPNRAAATVVASGMTAPHQISLHEDHACAYVVEYGGAGQLVRVALPGGAKTNVAFGLQNCVGLAVTSDLQYAYVSEQAASGGRVRRVNLNSGAIDNVASGLSAPFMLTFVDAAQSALLVTERDPSNKVKLIELGTAPAGVTTVATGLPMRPSSAALVMGSRLVVCCDTVLAATELADALFTGTGPLLMGIGHVPVSRINGGYADTSVDPGYFFQVKDSPFGGSLPVQFNHTRARLLGATYYKVQIDGVDVTAPWGDYRWNAALNTFEYVPILPDAGGFYAVRGAGELWFNAWLGLVRDTGDFANGLHTLQVRIYNALKLPIATPGITTQVQLMLDNSWPNAAIPSISHNGTPIGACAIVTSGPDVFRFEITAEDPQQHLLSWSLVALWGDNKSATIASDSYAAHVSPSKLWGGISGLVPPAPASWQAAVPGDPTSSKCAHTFVLNVWDRVINGYGYIHHASAHKSITIMLP